MKNKKSPRLPVRVPKQIFAMVFTPTEKLLIDCYSKDRSFTEIQKAITAQGWSADTRLVQKFNAIVKSFTPEATPEASSVEINLEASYSPSFSKGGVK